jgi:tRNA A-37 threonylcarbamoyl transferase component Bud32
VNPITCPKCKHVNPPGSTHCERCQAPLDRAQAADPPPQDSPKQPKQGADFILSRGQTLAGRYTIESMIGRGGMGCIYRAHDTVLKEIVALKTLLPQFVRNKVVVERFYNEARIARNLSHPNVIRVHDIGAAGSVLYISMEYLEGRSLRATLDQLLPGEHLPLSHVLAIMDGLCAALEYAHQYTIHRDIKPENVMITADGSVKLMDFGISKLMTNAQLTATAMVMGTPYYMSPEQRKDSSTVDARSDIYSMGVMLYEIATGNTPTGVMKAPSKIHGDLPPALDGIIARCVEPDPDDRYQTVADLRQALAAISGVSRASSSSLGAAMGGGKPGKLRTALGIALIALLVLGAGLGVIRLEQRRAQIAAHPRSLLAQSSQPGRRPSPQSPPKSPLENRLRALLDLVEPLHKAARGIAEKQEEQALKDVVELGEDFWTRAKRNSDPHSHAAILPMRHAIECFAAAIMWPDLPEMVLVPPMPPGADLQAGNPRTLEGVFFIDGAPVTSGDYQRFCRQRPWRLPSGLPRNSDTPVTGVAFYDAQEYALWAGKSLPTTAQWSLAARSAGHAAGVIAWKQEWSMPRGFLEWTRTPDGQLPEPQRVSDEDLDKRLFLTPLIVVGAGIPAHAAKPLSFRRDAAQPNLGFRCVQRIPLEPDTLEDLVRKAETRQPTPSDS